MADLSRSFGSTLRQGARFWQTVRHLSVAQVGTRLRVRLLRRWWRAIDRRAKGGSPVGLARHEALRRPEGSGNDAALQAARTVTAGLGSDEFEFLRRSHRFDGGIAWNIPQQTQLWRFHLHYFSYVRELMLVDGAGGDTGFRQFRRLSASWIAGNTRITGDGWHPYTLSLRIINWLKASLFWRAQGDQEADWRDHLGRSLRHQARFLEAQLEYDVRGNHLLENGRALVWLGLVAEDPAAAGWLRRGLSILEAELPEQVLPDGCHFERCPGYHFSILLSLTELCGLFDLSGRARPACLTEAVQHMVLFGRRILLPGGSYPLFKDSAADQVPLAPERILAAATQVMNPAVTPAELRRMVFLGETDTVATLPDPVTAVPSSGFCVARGGEEMLVFDVGAPCPNYLPAHAHADSLSYEFHAGRAPLVVDSGVFEYTAGPWRDYFRSTVAHSTIGIDGKNSSDVWGSFRVGRRARVRLIREEQSDTTTLFEAEHDGFAHLPGAARHRRLMAWRRGGWLAVFDRVRGEGIHEVENLIHFHPGIRPGAVERSATGWRISLNPSGWHLLVPAAAGTPEIVRGREVRPLQGWHSSEFGRREPASVVCLKIRSALPYATAYVLTPDPELVSTLSPGGRLEIAGSGELRSYSMTDSPSTVLRP